MAPHVMANDGLIRTGGRPSTPAALIWLERMTQKLIASWAWYDTYRHTARELSQLTNRELDDIGIARADIPTIALQAANAAQDRQ
ncbi:MAG: DUF1127 domain-containing protein [Pseudomonadota bacterium]